MVRARPRAAALLVPPTHRTGPARVTQNYEEALRIAEAREREVRSFFDKFDVDGSGTIDMEEILAIMEEMGLLKNLKTDRITFCAEMFVKYDANDDGVLRCVRPAPLLRGHPRSTRAGGAACVSAHAAARTDRLSPRAAQL